MSYRIEQNDNDIFENFIIKDRSAIYLVKN